MAEEHDPNAPTPSAEPTELVRRLLQRAVAPVGVIDVRGPQERAERGQAWVRRHILLIEPQLSRLQAQVESHETSGLVLVGRPVGPPPAEDPRPSADEAGSSAAPRPVEDGLATPQAQRPEASRIDPEALALGRKPRSPSESEGPPASGPSASLAEPKSSPPVASLLVARTAVAPETFSSIQRRSTVAGQSLDLASVRAGHSTSAVPRSVTPPGERAPLRVAGAAAAAAASEDLRVRPNLVLAQWTELGLEPKNDAPSRGSEKPAARPHSSGEAEPTETTTSPAPTSGASPDPFGFARGPERPPAWAQGEASNAESAEPLPLARDPVTLAPVPVRHEPTTESRESRTESSPRPELVWRRTTQGSSASGAAPGAGTDETPRSSSGPGGRAFTTPSLGAKVRALGGETPAPPSPTPPSGPVPAAAAAGAEPTATEARGIDLGRLAEQVTRIILRQVAVERERRGSGRWP